MTRHRALNWLLATIIALLMACAHMLDGPSDIEAMHDVATDVKDAIQTAQAQANEVRP
jgi:hypothetical protein